MNKYLTANIYRANKMAKPAKKKKKFDILRTFEIFNKESLSVLKNRLLEIVLLETDNIFAGNVPFTVDLKKDDKVQVTVINDKKTFDLLANTWRRQKKRMKTVQGTNNRIVSGKK